MSNQPLNNLSPELLLPAGSPEKLRYALAYGADAVYAGVPLFSLRARENSFREESIVQAIEYTHALGKKIYLTMNIYAHNNRVERFLDSFLRYSEYGPDGFIMTDTGLIAQALKLKPQATIHLSTQANATNWATAMFWRDLGVKRIILSRELSLEEIATIHAKVPDIELEAFVHGSICIAYSGRCLISNYLNHRDANEGTCTNSCRWQYNLQHEEGSLVQLENKLAETAKPRRELEGTYYLTESKRQLSATPDTNANTAAEERFEFDEDEHGTYMMNSKDLCAIELLHELKAAGVCSFKVEGRNKTLYYLATVGRSYRGAIDDLDAGRPFDPTHLRTVMSTSNRTLMTGFLLRRPNEYGENFADGSSESLNHQYAGQVLEIDRESQQALVNFKSKVALGDIQEWFEPRRTVSATINTLENEKHQPISEIHGGLSGWVNCPDSLSEFALLRAPKN